MKSRAVQSTSRIAYAAILALGLFGTGAFSAVQAQGTVRGRIVDAATGEALPGASAVLEGSNYGGASDRDGYYAIRQVAPGTYTLVVSYLGYDEFETEVTVARGETVRQEVALEQSYIEAEGVTVEGLRQGQAKALNQQRTSATITNVVDREQMELFPDLNTAEVLQRIPGVNVSRSFGEGKFVFIRGTEPRLTGVTVNGQKIATPEDEERFVALNVISANQLASIEVTKALTPDMDADAIGGSVDLVTRGPFDTNGRVIRASAGAGYSQLGDQPLYQAELTYSSPFADNKFGVTVNANFNQVNRLTHNNEMRWDNEEDVDGNELPFALGDLQLRHYYNQRDRYGVNATVEYRPAQGSRYYVRGMFNKRDDLQNRNEYRVRFNRGDYLSATEVEEGRMIRAFQNRTESQIIANAAVGGENRLGNLEADYTLTYTYGEQNKDGQILPEFQLDERLNLGIDLADRDAPQWTVRNFDQDYPLNAANWELDAIDYRDEFTSDQETIGALNLEHPYRLGRYPGSVKFGGKVRLKTKDRNDERFRYKWEGDGDILLDQFASDDVTEEFFNDSYVFGPTTDNEALRRFFDQNRDGNLEGEIRYDDSIGDAYNAGEDIYATYGMGSLNFDRLLVLAGLRYEFTTTDYEGTRLSYNEDGDFVEAVPVADDRTYHALFPMAHLRYAATERTNVRLAFTSGIARANFFDLVPYFWVFPEDEEIRRGNSDLDPTRAYNIDLLGEHYFQGIGILSGGVFYKDLSNIIYDAQLIEEGGTFDGYDVEQPINGGDATLYGVEVNWQQQFAFLPGALGGLGIYANYTHTESDAELQFRERSLLPGQASDTGNLAVSYDRFGLNARLSLNFNGRYIDEVGSTEDFDEWVDDHFQVDFSASYDVTPLVNVYLNVVNLTNEPQRVYTGVSERPRQIEYYSWWASLGAKVSL